MRERLETVRVLYNQSHTLKTKEVEDKRWYFLS
jgi:hypothetical protein